MAGVHGVTGLALGGAHTLALRQTDDLLAWGANQNGVLGLGIGTSQDARTPMKVPKLTCSQVCCKPCCVSPSIYAQPVQWLLLPSTKQRVICCIPAEPDILSVLVHLRDAMQE